MDFDGVLLASTSARARLSVSGAQREVLISAAVLVERARTAVNAVRWRGGEVALAGVDGTRTALGVGHAGRRARHFRNVKDSRWI